jgi:hypothetical protein
VVDENACGYASASARLLGCWAARDARLLGLVSH